MNRMIMTLQGAGGGGAGGCIYEVSIPVVQSGTFSLVVGAGGLVGTNGGDTIVQFSSINTYIALGGQGGADYIGGNGGGVVFPPNYNIIINQGGLGGVTGNWNGGEGLPGPFFILGAGGGGIFFPPTTGNGGNCYLFRGGVGANVLHGGGGASANANGANGFGSGTKGSGGGDGIAIFRFYSQ